MYRFGDREILDSFIESSFLIKNLVFLSVYTWANGKREFEQKRIVASIVKESKSRMLSNVTASIAAHLNVEKINNLYSKEGTKENAKYSLSTEFKSSPQMRFIRFIPSENALKIVEKRAKDYHDKR